MPWRYVGAVVAVASAAALTAVFWPVIGDNPLLLFFPTVIGVALSGLGPGLVATALSALVLAYFFLPPYYSLKVGLGDLVRVSVFAGTTLMVTVLTSKRRRAERALRELSRDLETRVAARTRELRESERALEAAHRLEALGRMAGGVAHEFNNALMVITGNTDMLLMRASDTDARAMLLDMQAAAARGASISRQLLAYAHGEHLAPSLVDPNVIIENAAPKMRRCVGERVSFEVRLSKGLPRLWVDVEHVQQALMNVVSNATEATPAGGHVLITTELTQLVASDLKDQPDRVPGWYVVLSVTDTGLGMTDDLARRVFEPFYGTKPVGAGPGLGLSMAYGIVRQSGGFIRLTTAPQRGTTVRLFFPVPAEISPNPYEAPHLNHHPRGRVGLE